MNKGASIVEVLVALVVLAVTASAVFPVMWWLINKAGGLKYEAEASVVLQEGMEASYNVMVSDWEAMQTGLTYSPRVVVGGGTQRWGMVEGEEEVAARFTRGVAVTAVCRASDTGELVDCGEGGAVDANSKLLTATISWQEKDEDKSISATLLVVNI